MNERIKELAEQCWDRRLDGLHFDQEKFAELIIGHCCPKRSWVGLTNEDIACMDWESFVTKRDCANAIEAKLKEKNT